MKTYFNSLLLKFSFVSGIVFLLYACANTSSAEASEQNEVLAEPEATVFQIDEDQMKAGGIELGTIALHPFEKRMHAMGTLAVPPENQENISVFLPGTLTSITLLPGTKVKKGDVLFRVSGPAIIELQEQFLLSKSQIRTKEAFFKRQTALFKASLISEKEFLESQAAYEVELTHFHALRSKLNLLHINPSQLTPEGLLTAVPIHAPQSGFITEVHKSQGSFINPSDVIVTLLNTDSLHLEIQVFENDYPKLSVGQPIEFWLQNDAQRTYQGAVHLINKSVNENDRTLEVHGDILADNDKAQLAPGLYVEAEITTAAEERLSLPADAVVTLDNRHYVLVQTDTHQFKKVEIQVGEVVEKYVEITNSKDFLPNSKFVVKGAFGLITE
ncbi:MAG: efflux RND transporter periplasmic adaptor subunit [Flavobacteriaceae bacterium]